MPKRGPNAVWRRHWPRFLLVIPFLAIVWVPFYNRLEPTLGGIPFYYWYQLAWILIGAAIVIAVYVIETKISRVTQETPGIETTGPPGEPL